MNSKSTQEQKKPKNEFQEINKLFEEFEKTKETHKDINVNYYEVYRRNDMLKNFNQRIIECNRLCIKHPEIEVMLYEEQSCLENCQRKILEVDAVVKKYMNSIKANNINSEYLNF
jgi:hypothetical protein